MDTDYGVLDFFNKVEGLLTSYIVHSGLSLWENKPDFNARVARAVPIPKFPTTTKQRTVVANINAPAMTKWNALRNDAKNHKIAATSRK